MRKEITLIILLLFAGFTITLAQTTTIKGKISDNTNQPLPGVTVKVKGGTASTISDINGTYAIQASSASTLEFSFIGFTTKNVTVGNQTTVNVTLSEETKSLNEVVVIGFGTQKKSVVTGAISRVKASDLEDQQVTRIDQALQGRTSGVTVVAGSGAPGSAPTIRIRGITSINSSDPLYVVDGVVILNGGIDNINPNDIESIEVLKDASAAIYGSRSSAGVVLVTTKKGKAGEPQMSYSGYYGIQNPVKRVDLANASQYASLRNQALVNDGKTPTFDGHDSNHPSPATAGTGTNWQDQIFGSNARIQNQSLSMQGGTEKSTYFTSFGYLDQEGIIFPSVSNYKRYNFTVNTTTKPKTWITVGENFNYSYVRSQSNFNTNSEFGGPLSSALNLDPTLPTVITNLAGVGNPNDYKSPYIVRDGSGLPYGISGNISQEITNPLAQIQTVQGNYGWSHNLLGNAFVEIAPIKGLKLRSQIGGKQAFFGSQSFNPLYYLNSQSNNTTNPSGFRASNRNLTWNWDNTASYTRSIQKHNFSVLLGTSAQAQSEVDLNTTYNNLPITTYDQLSFNYNLPNANRIGGSGDAQPYHVSSLFSRLTYDYDQKYLLTGIIRRDGSSKFGSNNVYGVFPSAEIGWVATKEDFFPKNTFVDFLKFRGSYGVVGNEQSLGTFQYTSVVGGGRNYVFGTDVLTIGNSPVSPPNPNLKWETVHTSDIGFDATLFHDFNVTFDIYRKVTQGMLENVPLPAYAGFDSPFVDNVGNLENKGIELELGYRKQIGKFNINVNGNIAYNHNNVTYLGLTPFIDGGSFQSTTYGLFRTQAGHPVNSFYGFQELGVFHSQAEIDAYTLNGAKIQPNAKPGDFKWADTNGDGKIDQADRTFLGSQLPSWTYGFTLNTTYKNFDLKLFGQGVWGNKIFQGYRRLDIPAANYPAAALNAWSPTNTSSDYPRLTDSDPNHNFNNPSNFYLQSGAYFRIKTLQIGYSLPKEWLRKADINKVRIYVNSSNLATITKYTGFDPEIAGGVDRGIYPQSRTFSLGLDITL